MPEADGFVMSTAPTQLQAYFNVNGSNYRCSLKPDSQLPSFNLKSIKLDYDSEDQLMGTQSLSGHVGKSDFVTLFQ
ncbi:hypothetical protein ABHI18_007283 [Aspergillus niger]